ncbi:unnamed protein product [Acanthoscelides obtectus]|uniref:Uncharacterized protein n=1 Tax=Acanthoscelides obtectus TaxID=200917 RepID=A0A9P0K9E8_ACAOB|nr:unnamed protein product [Acanthoscelides obtectus]CAK1629315.1 hypothetical protein AOBTE_LOCUS5676 [Acanthoscelides obtectus]
MCEETFRETCQLFADRCRPVFLRDKICEKFRFHKKVVVVVITVVVVVVLVILSDSRVSSRSLQHPKAESIREDNKAQQIVRIPVGEVEKQRQI